ncbi:MAG: dipeptidase, partial [Cyclobacteriaceae bacterium]|nr:dipeptidase [Cyclobacteriaceae bacterium]
DSAVSKANDTNRKKLQALLAEKGLNIRDEAAKPIIEEFRKENPSLYADVKTVADHIDRVVQLAGIDHVGIGSDYDGVGDSLPTGLKDVSQFPNLIYELLRRGYSPEDIAKICYQNVWRVWNKVIEVAG